MTSAPRTPYPIPPAYAGLPLTADASAGGESTNPFAVEVWRLARLAAREEFQLLLTEQAIAAAQAEQDEKIDTVRSAAAIFNMREQTVYQWFKTGKLKGFKLGRAVRFKRGDVLAALKAQTQPDGRRKYARRTNTKKA